MDPASAMPVAWGPNGPVASTVPVPVGHWDELDLWGGEQSSMNSRGPTCPWADEACPCLAARSHSQGPLSSGLLPRMKHMLKASCGPSETQAMLVRFQRMRS